MTNDSEAELGNSGDSTSTSTNSSPSSSFGNFNLSRILDNTSDIKICFKQHFNRFMKVRTVVVNIRSLEGNIKISTVKIFYNDVSSSKVGPDISHTIHR